MLVKMSVFNVNILIKVVKDIESVNKIYNKNIYYIINLLYKI